MAHTRFQVEVVTPEGPAFNEEVEMVSTRTPLGMIGILANHEAMIATLEPTELRIYRSESEIVRFAQSEGYLRVGGNHVTLLVEDAKAPEQLDVSSVRERLAEAEREIHDAGDDTERRRVALRDQKRWKVFLEIAEGR